MSNEHVKVVFPLVQDEDGYPPVSAEALWARPVANGYQIDNIPFFARGVAVGDIVKARVTDQQGLEFIDVIEPSNHSTIRVLIDDVGRVPALRQHLSQIGCDTELSHIPNLIAVDVPPAVGLSNVKKLLQAGVEAGHWEFEEGCIGTN